MELEELIENTLRRKHLEEMMNRPEKEHTPLEGMDNEQIKRFALFLFEENQSKHLIPASEMFHISIAIILANIVVELSPVQKSG